MRLMMVSMMDAVCWDLLNPLAIFKGSFTKHTKEALFQNGQSIFNMGTSYDNITLVHLADHLIYVFSSSSFCFGLNSSYKPI